MTDPGYSIENHVLSHAACDSLVARLGEPGRDRGRAGMRHLMASPEVSALAYDDRLLDRAAEVLGGHAVPYRATLFDKSVRANWLVVWHQDTALPLVEHFDAEGWGPWSVKAGVHYAHAPTWALDRIVALRVHLDASTSDNGPLRVIPGSHHMGVLDDDAVFALAHRSEAVDCVVERGGIMSMRPLLVHSSSKARVDAPRRVLHIEYVDSLDLGNGAVLATA